MKITALLPYVLASLVHLYFCGADKQTGRRITKVMLLPLLALAYALSGGAEVTVFIALAMGWLGDIALIRPQGKIRQMLGIALFSVGHIFYIITMVHRMGALTLPWLPPVVFIAAMAAVYIIQLPVIPKDMRIAGAGYYLFLAAVSSCGGILLLSGAPCGVWLTAGMVMFLTSDSILCRQMFTVGDPAPKYDVAVMATYIAAQALLSAGFLA